MKNSAKRWSRAPARGAGVPAQERVRILVDVCMPSSRLRAGAESDHPRSRRRDDLQFRRSRSAISTGFAAYEMGAVDYVPCRLVRKCCAPRSGCSRTYRRTRQLEGQRRARTGAPARTAELEQSTAAWSKASRPQHGDCRWQMAPGLGLGQTATWCGRGQYSIFVSSPSSELTRRISRRCFIHISRTAPMWRSREASQSCEGIRIIRPGGEVALVRGTRCDIDRTRVVRVPGSRRHHRPQARRRTPEPVDREVTTGQKRTRWLAIDREPTRAQTYATFRR